MDVDRQVGYIATKWGTPEVVKLGTEFAKAVDADNAQCADRIYEDLEKIKKEVCRMTAESLSYWCMECTAFKRRIRDGEEDTKKLKCRKCKCMRWHIISAGKIGKSTLELAD